MNAYLETGISVVLTIFVFSIVVYVIQELIAANLKYRSKMLKASLEQILNGTNADEKLAAIFFNHPQIKLLQEKLQQLPSYVPAANFAMAVMDIVASKSGTNTGHLLNDFKAGIQKFQQANGELPVLFKTWADNSTDVKSLKETIEKWYNEYMDRVSGWYKNQYRWVTRIIAIAVALFFNLDMIRITETIYNDPVLKARLLSQAEKTVDQPDAVQQYYTTTIDTKIKAIDEKYEKLLADTVNYAGKKDSLKKSSDQEKETLIAGYNRKQYEVAKSLIDTLSTGSLVFGWSNYPWEIRDAATGEIRNASSNEILLLVLGLFIGAVAISMGAPFWFDLLVKLVNIRRAGIKPESKETK